MFETPNRKPGRVGPEQELSIPNVRVRRTERALTQQQLAEAVHVSRQTIIAVESGSRVPSIYLALKIAYILDSSVEQLWADQAIATAPTAGILFRVDL